MVPAVSVTLTSLLLLSLGGVRTAPLISSPWGQIVGTDGTSPGGAPYSMYRAIPYALPPVGERRFAKPVAHPGPGVGRVFNASSPGYICPQKSANPELQQFMNEDCLTLNVFVPVSSGTGPKTVMIWIHGGGFTVGSAVEYVPSELVTINDVIVVVIQYRLDVLGFLSSGDDVISGNFGLWDQALAIKWVKDNIQAFGGDPNSITLFGESVGAASVGYQLISPVNRGMTFRAILQSGTPYCNWALNRDPARAFQALANVTECLTAGSWADSMYYMVAGGRQRAEHQRILDCLRTKDAATLLKAVDSVPGPEGTSYFVSGTLWVPSVDGDFVPRAPVDLMRDVAYLADVGATSRDVMFGINNEEGGLLLEMLGYLRQSNGQAEDQGIPEGPPLDGSMARSMLTDQVLLQHGLDLVKDPHRLETLVNVLEFFYTQPLNGGKVKEQDVIDIFSDVYFVAPVVQFVEDLTKASDQMRSLGRPSGGRRYLYLFNYYPASRAGLTRGRGLYHGEDLAYQFDRNQLLGTSDTFGNDEVTLATTFKSMTTNFAKSGFPQLTLSTGERSWPDYSLAEEKYLSLEVVPRVDSYLYGKRVALWLDLLPSLVNSTRGINMGSWSMPWQQQQTYYPPGNTALGYNLVNQLPVRFTFKGRLTFFKLQ